MALAYPVTVKHNLQLITLPLCCNLNNFSTHVSVAFNIKYCPCQPHQSGLFTIVAHINKYHKEIPGAESISRPFS